MNGSTDPGYGLAAVDATSGLSLPWAANATVRNGGPNSAVTSLATPTGSRSTRPAMSSGPAATSRAP